MESKESILSVDLLNNKAINLKPHLQMVEDVASVSS